MFYRITQMHYADRLKAYDLGAGQQFFMWRIGMYPGVSMAELAVNGAYDNATVTRAQTVTFLWRLEGRPQAKTAGGFTDVPSREYFAAAVDWAVEQGITNGVGGGKFAPGNNCTRAQIVTFLHRDLT